MSYRIDRRDLIKITAGAAIAAKAATTESKPRFFTSDEFALVDELAEMIIPADDHSPGARAANVAAYIDATVAEAFEDKRRTSWRSGLELVEKLSHEQSGTRFLRSTPEERMRVLTAMATNEDNPKTPAEQFFQQLKAATVKGYYSSSIGIHQDMEYKGNTILQEFVGYEVK
jgi:hypothetical protein